jgi:hypothetical protein
VTSFHAGYCGSHLPSVASIVSCDEVQHLGEVLARPLRPIGPGLRIHAGQADRRDRLGDIPRTEPAGENCWYADAVNNPPAEAPVKYSKIFSC